MRQRPQQVRAVPGPGWAIAIGMMGEMDADLLIEAGRVVCPATGRDGPGAVAVRGDRIVAVGEAVAARRVLRFPEGILLPGLIDLHAHPAREGSKFGRGPGCRDAAARRDDGDVAGRRRGR